MKSNFTRSVAPTLGLLILASSAALVTTSCQQKTAGSGTSTGAAGKYSVGEVASAFALPDADGKQVDLKEVFGKRPAVLVFYRGNW